jgi:hypothetical protein
VVTVMTFIFIKDGDFLEFLGDFQLHKKDPPYMEFGFKRDPFLLRKMILKIWYTVPTLNILSY